MPPNSVSAPPRPARPFRVVGLLIGTAMLAATAACSSTGTPPADARAGAHLDAVGSPVSVGCRHRDTGLFDDGRDLTGVRLDTLDALATATTGWLYAGAGAPCGSGWLAAVAHLASTPLPRAAAGPADTAAALVEEVEQ